MQKKLIALAIAGLASSAVFAQSNVTIYGRVDAGFAHYSGTSAAVNSGAGSWNGIQGGLNRTNLIGFKGEEALGNGLKAVWNYEMNLNTDGGADAQSAGTTGLDATGFRIAALGLSGNFGTVEFGRNYTPFFQVVAAVDPFATSAGPGSATIIHPLAGTTVRYSSSVRYTSPSISGFQAKVMYGFGENASNAATKDNAWSFSGIYANGPVVLALAHLNNKKMALGTAGGAAVALDVKSTLVGGAYNFGVANLSLAYNALKSEAGALKNGDWHLGLVFPMGASAIQFAYNRANDKTVTNFDANHFALGYSYDMSKRTTLYAQYGKVKNKNGAAYAVNTSGLAAIQGANGLAAVAGTARESGFVAGVRHSF